MADVHLYEPIDGPDGPMWKCVNADVTIPYSRVNDDYCDCPDGSDEPGMCLQACLLTTGTSACAEGWFYCENKGHIPGKIRSNRVNDGVCGASYRGWRV